MLVWNRLVALLVVAIMAAQPAMACCLTGHPASVAEAAQKDTPPCHAPGMQMAAAGTPDTPDTSTDCPGCDGCDSAVMQAQASGDNLILSGAASEIPLAVLSAQFPGFSYRPVIFRTGPPGEPARPLTTPISLKQRLLI